MADYSYSALEVLVNANTRPLEDSIRSSATKAGEEASQTISGHLGKGLAAVAPIAGKIGKSVATGLGLATTAAVAFGVKAFKAASQVESMNASLRALAKANHVSYQAMTQTVDSLVKMGISTEDAQTLVGRLTSGHIKLAAATKLAAVAQNASVVTGNSLESTTQAITKAVLSGNSSALKRQGIVVDTTAAMAAYAKANGVAVSDISQQAKSQITLNAVLKAGKTISGAYAAQLKTPQGALRLLKHDADEATISVGTGLVQAMTPAFAGLAKLGGAVGEAVAPGGKLTPIITAIGQSAAKAIGPVTHLITVITGWIDQVKPAQIQAIADGIKRFGPALAGVGAAAAIFTGSGLLTKLPVVGGMLTNLLGPLTAVKGAMVSVGKAALVQFVPSLEGSVGEIGKLGTSLGTFAGPVALAVGGFALLMAVSPQFRAAIMDIAKTLLVSLHPALTALIQIVMALVPPFVGLARVLGSVLAPILLALVPVIRVLGDLLTLLTPALVPLVKIVLALWAAVKLWAAVQWVLDAALNANPIGLVVIALAALGVALVEAYKHSATFRTIVNDTWTVIRTVVMTTLRVIGTAIKVYFDTYKAIITTVLRVIAALVTGNMTALRNVFHVNLSAIVGFARSAVSNILGAFRNLAGSLAGLGRSAIHNLLSGMESALGNIGGWVKAHLVDPIVNAVKHFFGIHSPSTVMGGLGENVSLGFMGGIVRTNPLTVAKDVFGSIPKALGHIVAKGLVSVASLPGKALKLLGGLGSSIGGLLTKIPGILGFGGGGGGGGTGAYVGIMRAVLSHFGIPQLLSVFMAQMMTESGGNPKAINLWDSNAAAGTPSKGLMQVIQPTFDSYAGPYKGRGIYDPLANIYAAVAYAIARYGSSIGAVLGHGHGYASGGIINEPITGFGRSGRAYFFGERGPEMISPLTGPNAVTPATGGGRHITVNVYPQQGQSETAIAAAVSRRMGWAEATGRA